MTNLYSELSKLISNDQLIERAWNLFEAHVNFLLQWIKKPGKS